MSKHPIEKLMDVMAKLRDPNGGCPWDLQQDFKSIAPYTIEEAYEVADAIAKNDMKDLREELGDLLLQPIYHAQMAKEAGHFNFLDVIEDITNKMISRHPHVFGDAQARTASDVNAIWDQKKTEENQKKDERTDKSLMDEVPKAFPALLRAKKLQSKAAKVGFEWKHTDDVLNKLDEEIGELREAMAGKDEAHKKEEFGDIMFVLVNYARMNGIDAEDALRNCCDKFETRFRGIENDLKASGKGFQDTNLEEMEQMWIKQKKKA